MGAGRPPVLYSRAGEESCCHELEFARTRSDRSLKKLASNLILSMNG